MKPEEYICEDHPKCPYCGHLDTYFTYEGGQCFEHQCAECELNYEVEPQFEVYYDSRTDCKLNNEEHDWEKTRLSTIGSDRYQHWGCTKCSKKRVTEAVVESEGE